MTFLVSLLHLPATLLVPSMSITTVLYCMRHVYLCSVLTRAQRNCPFILFVHSTVLLHLILCTLPLRYYRHYTRPNGLPICNVYTYLIIPLFTLFLNMLGALSQSVVYVSSLYWQSSYVLVCDLIIPCIVYSQVTAYVYFSAIFSSPALIALPFACSHCSPFFLLCPSP